MRPACYCWWDFLPGERSLLVLGQIPAPLLQSSHQSVLHTRDFPSSYAPASRESWRDLTQPIAGSTTGFFLHILGPDPPFPSTSDMLVPTVQQVDLSVPDCIGLPDSE